MLEGINFVQMPSDATTYLFLSLPLPDTRITDTQCEVCCLSSYTEHSIFISNGSLSSLSSLLSIYYIYALDTPLATTTSPSTQDMSTGTARLTDAAESSAQRIYENKKVPLHPNGCGAGALLFYNKKWSAAVRSKDPNYFTALAEGQSPEYLYVGCCDSRVEPADMLGVLPGDLFVHRSVAGLCPVSDSNIMSAVQYAVHHLHVHVILVTGHHRCGGVAAAYKGAKLGFAEEHLHELHRLRDILYDRLESSIADPTARLDAFSELSAIYQAANLAFSPVVEGQWAAERQPGWKGKPLEVLAAVFVLPKGLLRPLALWTSQTTNIKAKVEEAVNEVFARYQRPPHQHTFNDVCGCEEAVLAKLKQ